MTEAEIAWVAGIVEGEGCITLVKRQTKRPDAPRNTGRLTVKMNDEDIIRRLHSLTGVGTVCRESRGQFAWQVQKRADVPPILRTLLPWMGARRTARINEVLAAHEERMFVYGARHWRAKLSDDQVAEIRERYAVGGISQTALAREYGVNQTNISSIVRGDTYKVIG